MFARRAARHYLIAAALALFLLELIRTAWVCDDAYITFRTVDNFVHGYGLRWNVDERVQGFTHPLWMLVVSLAYVVTREAYFTAIALSVLCSLAALTIYVRDIAASTATAVLGVLILTASAGFVDYSTSGLENPLVHLLLAAFLAVYWRDASQRRLLWLGGVSALLLITRLDAGLLVLPAVAQACLASRQRKRDVRLLCLALLPFVAWEVFSLVYFGFPFANTAYAKLKTGIPGSELRLQGFLYLFESSNTDPLALATMLTGIAAGLIAGPASRRVIAVGIALHLAYVVNVGGDFMSGRFLTAAMFAAVCLLGSLPLPALDVAWPMPAALALAVVAGGTALRPNSPRSGSTWIAPSRVTNERAYFFPTNGLVNYQPGLPWPAHEWATKGRDARRGHDRVIVQAAVGMFGFEAGPAIHIIDPLGLTDPLVARLPARVRWQVGHFGRRIPDGYPQSIANGPSTIADSGVRAYEEALRQIVRGPIWTRERFSAIWTMNTGGYESLLAHYGQLDVQLSALSTRLPEGLPWDAPGTIHWDELVRQPEPGAPPAPEIIYEQGIRVDFAGPRRLRQIELSLSGNDNYVVTLYDGDDVRASVMLSADPVSDGSLAWRTVAVPEGAGLADHLVIRPRAGDFRYSLGHVRLAE